ncbi:MAG: replication initiation protein [Methylococcales bacterium]
MNKCKNKKKLRLSSSIVTQSNELVSARYTLPLSEQRLLLTMIARIQPDDEDFKPYKISIGELADFLGVARGSAYRECKRITKSLLTRVVEIRDGDTLIQIGWVSSAVYVDGAGMVVLSFDPLLKPFLLQLKGNFTSCKLEMLLSFKSQYTMRMYTFLKQYERLKEREIELDKLRDMLGLRVDQHIEYKNFKTNILNSVQKELAEKADLMFEYDEIKYGRRIGAIRFHIFSKKQTSSIVDNASEHAANIVSPLSEKNISPPLLSPLLLLVPELHQARKTVQTALEVFEKKHGFDYVKRNVLYSNAKAEKSYAGFLNNALKEDWGRDWELDQEAKQGNKKIIEIWERNGFASEKEYNDHMYRKQMEHYGRQLN